MLFDISKSCCKVDARRVVSEENGNKHAINNPSQHEIYQYHIDGDIVNGTEGRRCDYIVEVNPKNCTPIVYVIELKGSDLNAAICQINSTVAMFKEKLHGYRIMPRIIIHKTSSHDIHGSVYRKLKKSYPGAVLRSQYYEDNV